MYYIFGRFESFGPSGTGYTLSFCLSRRIAKSVSYLYEALLDSGRSVDFTIKSGHYLKDGMKIHQLAIPDVKLIIPKRFGDARGSFAETWSDRRFREEVADIAFVQDNESNSTGKGTVRGLHFQRPPFAQGKLIRVVSGSIFDVAVDIRKGSATYGEHLAVTLDATEGGQLWVPEGFLHGFCTLEDATIVFYKVTAYCSPDHDAGVLWNDPEIGIRWPVDADSAVLSDKDRQHPRFCDLQNYFCHYD